MMTIKYNGVEMNVADPIKAKAIWQTLALALTSPVLQSQAIQVKPRTKLMPHKLFKKGAKIWTQEEYDKLIERFNSLQQGGLKNRSKAIKILAKEFTNRTDVAIGARLQDYVKGKPFVPKRKGGRWQNKQTQTTELLNADPTGEITI